MDELEKRRMRIEKLRSMVFDSSAVHYKRMKLEEIINDQNFSIEERAIA